jgi:serine protease Do
MKDLDNGVGNSFIEDSDSQNNKDLIDEVTDHVQDNQDVQESTSQGEKKLEVESENNVAKEESSYTKKETDKQEDKNPEAETDRTQDQVGSDESVNKGYSSYYKPPYYVPNFTVENGNTSTPIEQQVQFEKEKTRSSFSSKMVIMLCAVIVCLFISFVLGAFSGRFLPDFSVNGNNTLDLKDESITVVKNSPQLNVIENMPADYVPQSLPEVVQKVGNSVVEISTSSVVTDRFYGQYVTSGAGSGVIITQNENAGYLLTNHHVIENAKTITVRLTNKEEYNATILGSNRSLDLAVVRIEKKSDEIFTVAPIGDSAKLIVGQDVIAIGNPLGSLGGTVTDGIVSALDRNVSIDGVSMTLLQHNAAINPGNSGGALFDMMGNLVGIVNAKTSDTGIEGLGFAIPVNIAFEYFKGVMQASSIGATVDYGYNSERIYGVYVIKANEGSKLQRLDRIISINGAAIEDLSDFYSRIDDFKTGDTINITVVRNKTEMVVEVTLNQN